MNTLNHLAIFFKQLSSEQEEQVLKLIKQAKIPEISIYKDYTHQELLCLDTEVKFNVKVNYRKLNNAREELLSAIKDGKKDLINQTYDLLFISGDFDNSLMNNCLLEASYAEIYFCEHSKANYLDITELRAALNLFSSCKRNFGA